MATPPRADEHHESAATLVNAFLTSATSEFASLVAGSDASWSVRVEHSTVRGLVPVAPEDITGFFWITCAFETPRISGRITYGDKEFDIETELGPTRGTERYPLWQWAYALGRPEVVPATGWVMTVDRLERIVSGFARATLALSDDVARADPAIIERIERERREAQAASEERDARDDHRRASAAAAEAFAKRDFDRVVKLLTPFEAVLTPAERKKLHYARTHG